MTVYIELEEKVKIIKRKIIYLQDISSLYCDNEEYENKLKNILIFEIKENKEKKYLISLLKVIKKIKESFPDINIESYGSEELVLTYLDEEEKIRPVFNFVKVLFVATCLFLGAATAIISFHIDSDIPKIFRSLHYVFFNETVENPYIMDIPYSIGVSMGILVFFNRFNKKQEKDEPSPIDVEISSYEEEKLNTLKNKLEGRDEKR